MPGFEQYLKHCCKHVCVCVSACVISYFCLRVALSGWFQREASRGPNLGPPPFDRRLHWSHRPRKWSCQNRAPWWYPLSPLSNILFAGLSSDPLKVKLSSGSNENSTTTYNRKTSGAGWLGPLGTNKLEVPQKELSLLEPFWAGLIGKPRHSHALNLRGSDAHPAALAP